MLNDKESYPKETGGGARGSSPEQERRKSTRTCKHSLEIVIKIRGVRFFFGVILNGLDLFYFM